MSETVSFKVPKKIKEEMNKLKGKIDWPKELRKHVIDIIERTRKEEVFNEVMEKLKEIGPANVPQGFSIRSVREDRDSY
jgi:hypothetical protein